MRLRSGDTVKVLIGKDRGKTGLIRKIFPKLNSAIVENVNIYKKHQKPTSSSPAGGIVEKAMPIKADNLVLICSECQKPTKISYKTLEDGKKVRVCKVCTKEIK